MSKYGVFSGPNTGKYGRKYVLDENLSGEPMALQVIKKINTRLRFLYRKNRFLSQPFRRLLSTAIIQPHFDYVCSFWYPNLNKRLNTPEKMYTFLSEFEYSQVPKRPPRSFFFKKCSKPPHPALIRTVYE